MAIHKLMSHFISIVIMCTFHSGAYGKAHLGTSENSTIKFSQRNNAFGIFKGTMKITASVGGLEECPNRRGDFSFFEFRVCQKQFFQHVSYRCNMQCLGNDTENIDCEIYNCTIRFHCDSGDGETIPKEQVCDNIDQCPYSDDESTCIRPCLPSSMCIGLILNYRETNMDVSRFHSEHFVNYTTENDHQSEDFPHLRYFSYLVINGINSIPEGFLGRLDSIKSLEVSSSKIFFLSDFMFRDKPNLESLDLSSNMINHLPNNVFNGLSHLINLDLSNNLIEDLPITVFNGLFLLEELDISRNQISYLTGNIFHGLSALEYLNLEQNQIALLPANAFTGLYVLSSLKLGGNQIANLPENVFNGLSTLYDLYLNDNQITFLSENVFNSLTVLARLTLSGNHLTHLPGNVFKGLTEMATLYLSKNQITFLADNIFNNLTKLLSLDLSENQITFLPVNAFSGLTGLLELRFSQNHISVLSDDIFTRLQGISVIFLDGNKLSALPALPLTVTVLDISYNSFTNLRKGFFINNSEMSLLNIAGNDIEVTENMFEGLDNLKTIITDNPFMCCVKPKSVTENRCIKTQVANIDLLRQCYDRLKSCKSKVDAISSCDALIGSVIQRVCLWFIGVSALLGNIFVFFYRLFLDRDNITKSYSLFVLNLSISDFLMGVYLLIIGFTDVYYDGVYAWKDQQWRRSIMCTTAGILSTISSEMSSFLILLVTIDRVMVIVFPMSRLSQRNISWKQAIIISVSLWMVSVALAIIPVTCLQSYFKGQYYSQSGVCLALPLTGDKRPGSEYSFALFVCLNSIIFIVIVIGQICIFKSIVTSGGHLSSSRSRQRDVSVAKSLFMVVASDFCCWFPIGVMGVMSKSGYAIPDDAYAWVMIFVLPVNAAINPFLYTATEIWRKRQRER